MYLKERRAVKAQWTPNSTDVEGLMTLKGAYRSG